MVATPDAAIWQGKSGVLKTDKFVVYAKSFVCRKDFLGIIIYSSFLC